MSKQHRTKHIKSLEEQLATTNDPKIKADLSRQLTKLLSKPTRKGSSRKPVATPSNKKASIINRVTGTAVDQLSPKDKVSHYLVDELEKEQRKQGRKFSEDERKAFWGGLFEVLAAEDRTAYEALNGEVA
jgi:hypothetical protein